MRRCVRAELRALRQLERHSGWLRKNIPSRSIQQQRQRQQLELRSQLACAWAVVAVILRLC